MMTDQKPFHDITVDSSEAGQKLLKFLLRKTDGTKIFLYKCFRKKKIRVNGKPVTQDYIVQDGDIVTASGLMERPVANIVRGRSQEVPLLYCDERIVVADKDGQTLVHAANRSDYDQSLVERVRATLRSRGERCEYLVPVHRLDKQTFGVVIMARTALAAHEVGDVFREGNLGKWYEVLVHGVLKNKCFLQADIIRNPEGGVRVENLVSYPTVPAKKVWLEQYYVHSSTISGTIVEPLESHGPYTRCRVELWTGRHHQIRAVLSALDHSVVGDNRYRGKRRDAHGGQLLVCKEMRLPEFGASFISDYEIDIRSLSIEYKGRF